MSYWLGLDDAMGSLAGGEQSAMQPPVRVQPAKIPVPTGPPDEEPEDDPEDEPDEEPEDDPEDEPEEEPEDEPDEDPEDDPEDEPEEEPEDEPDEDPEDEPEEEPEDEPDEEPDEDPDPEPLDGPPSSPLKSVFPAPPEHAPGPNAARTNTVPTIPRFIRANLLRKRKPSQKACLRKHDRNTVRISPEWTTSRPGPGR